MKKIFRKSNIFSFLLGAIIFGGIGIVSAYTILANDIEYTPKDTTWKVDNVKEAIDDLYTTANTRITGLNSQISTLQINNNVKDTTINSLNTRINELEGQIDSQNSAVTVSFNMPTSGTVTKNVGFRPTFISCTHTKSTNTYVVTYDLKNDNKVICSMNGAYNGVFDLSTWYTITDTGFIYNYAVSDTSWMFYNATIYCTLSK